MLTHNMKQTMVLSAGRAVSRGKLKPTGAKSNSAKDVLIWPNSHLNGQEGEEQVVAAAD